MVVARSIWLKMKNKISTLLVFVWWLAPQLVTAQCAMCRAVLESEENISTAEAVNNGIVYLMAIPYVLVAVLFFVVYKKMKS